MARTAAASVRRWLAVAPPKVNLALHVHAKRTSDGYHLLDSIVAITHGVADQLEVSEAPAWELQISGPYAAGVPTDATNLITRVAQCLAQHHGTNALPPLRVQLHKAIPHGAGLGGGSMDGAAMAEIVRAYWRTDWSLETLQRWLLPLGADLPVALAARHHGWLRMEGIGEQVTALADWAALTPHAVLAVPPTPAPTGAIYAALQPADYAPTWAALPPATEALGWLADTRNSLQPAALTHCPAIAPLLASLQQQPHCQLARMTGSGSGVFGLFPDAASARQAVHALRHAHADSWVQPVQLGILPPPLTSDFL